MRARVIGILGLSAALVSGLQACGSDDGGAVTKDKGETDAGTGGSSGNSAGGSAGAGATGGGGAAACDTTACDQQIAPLQGIVGGFITLKSCCVNATTCGIDTSGLGAVLGGAVQLPSCIDPSALIPPSTDAGRPPATPPITVLDGGVIPVNGGDDILLDPACPDINATGFFSLPGCCRPSGTCGGSTHTLIGAGTTVPLVCASYDDVAGSASSQFGNLVTIPADPNIHCDYTIGQPPVPEAGPGSDAGPQPKPDASTPGNPDASPGTPDAGPGGKKDAGPGNPDAGPGGNKDSGPVGDARSPRPDAAPAGSPDAAPVPPSSSTG